MAKKKINKVEAMVEAFAEYEEKRNIPKEAVIEALRISTQNAFNKVAFDDEVNSRVVVDEEKGEVYIYWQRNVVEQLENDFYKNIDIPLEEAKKHNKNIKVGDIYEELYPLEKLSRAVIQRIKSNFIQQIKETGKKLVYDKYKNVQGNIITGTVEKVEDGKYVLVNLGEAYGFMPFKETIPGEVYNVDETIKVYVKEVNMESKKESIILSRSDARFLFKLFSHEIPEIENGDIYIRSIARLPGVRSKIVVSSKVPGLDAAGTCIGKSGSRIIKIVEQLARGAEKIDVIEYYDDPLLTLKAALSPAIVEGIGTRKEPMKAMVYSSETKRKEEKSFIGEVADVVVSNETFTLAIGIRGQNAFLAKKLSKFDKLNIVRVDDALGKINYRRMAEIEAEYAAKNNGFVSEEEVIVRPTVETKPVTNVETETISEREFNKEAVPTPTPTTIEEYVEVTPISVAKGPHINVVEVEKKEETPVEVEVHTGPSKKSIKKEEELAKKLAEEEARRNGMAIYSEEELAEFEQEEYIDEEEDEIDYEDYDEYYDSY